MHEILGGKTMLLKTSVEAAILIACCVCACGAVQVPKFQCIVLDDSFPGGYQVKVADIDGDGKPDVVALGETAAGQVAWYKNPTWKRYPISIDRTKNNIDLALHDIDGDGELEIALASDFQLGDSASGGTISWLKRGKSLEEPWEVHRIDAEPTAHRLRWADVDGDGRKELACAPIVGPGAKAPQYDQVPVRLVLYRIPKSDLSDAWPKEIIDETLHMMHALEVCDFDGDGRDELLTGSFEGVHLFDLQGEGESARWKKIQLCAGDQSGTSARGSSEISVGQLGGGRRFIATIDPWHGNQVVVYLPPVSQHAGKDSPYAPEQNPPTSWQRHVLDESLSQGHAVCCADFNRDGSDEIIAGFRGKGGGTYIYCATDESGTRWEKSVLNEREIAAQGFSVFDFDPTDFSPKGDRHPDFVATGGATHNVHLYLNVTSAGPTR
jgi:hypothetical protein